MTIELNKVVKTYRAFAGIPALVGGEIKYGNGTVITSTWNVRNLERGRTTKINRTHLLTSELQKAGDGIPVDVSGESLTSSSPSEKYRAVVREVEEKDGRKQYLEIWSLSTVVSIVDLAACDVHGDVYTDGEFGGLQWSPDETRILYVAEKKRPKGEPFYKRQPIKEEGEENKEKTKGEQFVYKQDWGEQLINKKQSVIVQYSLATESMEIVEGVPEGLCPGQPIWGPDGSFIVGVAFRTEPRKLGLIYCSNRPCAIFTLDFNKNYDEISPMGKAVRSPRFTPDGKTLIWLQRDAEGPHWSCMALVKQEVPLNADNKIEPKVVVDVVVSQETIHNAVQFYGLYNLGFPKRCWATDRRLLLTTNQKNTSNTYVVDIDTGTVTELEYSTGSQMILDVSKDVILVNQRNFFVPDKLAIAVLPPKGKEASIVFHEITESQRMEFSHNCAFQYLDLKYDGTTDAVSTFSAIYVGPKDGDAKQFPLIVWPHGGPHSAFTNNLALEFSLYAALGSIGTGQSSINFLLGRIGESDVSDCVFATQRALERFPWLDPERMVLVGGSHGGFLVTHVSGQHPDMFRAVVARNPVIDLASMSVTSDIADWCYVESGYNYTQMGQPKEEQLLAMRKVSPIQHAHKVKAPTLLQVGSKDVRVPPSQAEEYYHRLKANNIPVRMNLYDDNHPLGTVSNEMDNLINTILWIEQHINL